MTGITSKISCKLPFGLFINVADAQNRIVVAANKSCAKVQATMFDGSMTSGVIKPVL